MRFHIVITPVRAAKALAGAGFSMSAMTMKRSPPSLRQCSVTALLPPTMSVAARPGLRASRA